MIPFITALDRSAAREETERVAGDDRRDRDDDQHARTDDRRAEDGDRAERTDRSAATEGTLKPLETQVVVVTGATSGIGLTTARMAADRGARVVLVARSEDALRELTEEIRRGGGEATYAVADVGDRDDVREVVGVAQETFGGVDTWINVAGAFIYGKLEDVPVEDMREQFDTNVWGLLYGSLEAADHLRERGGGAIINVGSAASDRALPLQGSYSASKHAVKGFTDALRMELEAEGEPISVTLVKPGAVATPYPEHAKNYMDREATLPPPLYAPETVARAILHAAEHPQRDVYVGAGGKGLSALGTYASRLTDRIMEATFFDGQQTESPAGPLEENSLDGPAGELEADGEFDSYVARNSLYTRLTQNRGKARFALLGLLLVGVGYALARLAGRGDG